MIRWEKSLTTLLESEAWMMIVGNCARVALLKVNSIFLEESNLAGGFNCAVKRIFAGLVLPVERAAHEASNPLGY